MPSNPLRVSAGFGPYEEHDNIFLNRDILGISEYDSSFNYSFEMMEGVKSSVQQEADVKGKNVSYEPKKISVPKSFKEALAGSSSNDVSGILISSSLVNGMPAILVSDKDLQILAEPYKLALVGKFFFRRPNMDEIRKFFNGLKLLGSFSVSLLDARHIFINLSNDLDYNRIFLKRSYYVRNCQLRILKWSTDFDIHAESPICPVWLSLSNLRMHFFDIKMLQAIGSLFGRPLQSKEVKSNQINSTNSPSKEEVHDNSLNDYLEKMEKDLENLEDPKHVTIPNMVSDVLSSSIMEKQLDLVVYDENIALQNSFCALDYIIPVVNDQVVANNALPVRLGSEIHVHKNVENPISDVNPIVNCAFNKPSESLKEGCSLEKFVGKHIVNNDLEEGEWESGFCSETELVVGKNKALFAGWVAVSGDGCCLVGAVWLLQLDVFVLRCSALFLAAVVLRLVLRFQVVGLYWFCGKLFVESAFGLLVA
ncbi:hypothetical protein M5K25_017749 [Dendrobium thyrsiflorum]|uniref:DUF4283 domain-containing protein n=1 Tax=Dendrobium thyrsiflorum TaxID=117978 RepID=A0ABD0UN54_DENTH